MSNIQKNNVKSNNLKEFLNKSNLKNFIKLSYKEVNQLSEKELLKGLKFFRTDLNYDLRKPLTRYKKNKIKGIRDIYLSTRQVPSPYLYTPRKEHIKTTQEYLALGKNWKKFVINKDRNKKIYFKNDRLRIKGVFTDEGRGVFDLEKLIIDPEKEIKRVLKGEKFDVSKLICGDAFIGGHANFQDYGDENNSATVPALVNEVNNLMNKYDSPTANNYFENWLVGVELVKFSNQKKSKKKFKSKIGKKKLNRKNKVKNNDTKTNRGRRL